MSKWIAVDWGTTNFRAFLLDEAGQLLKRIETPQGLLSVKNGQFAEVLSQLLASFGNFAHLPVYMAGMVGSNQGWCNVPYIETPLTLSQLSKHLVTLPLPWNNIAYIVPGISCKNDYGYYDVMRGEETQLLGIEFNRNQESNNVILPGTHSKHVVIQNNILQNFTTAMTGEMFSVIKQHTILTTNVTQEFSLTAFLRGVEVGGRTPLTTALFSGRTEQLFKQLESIHMESYLSGLLIGSELTHYKGEYFYIVGGENLSFSYQEALHFLGKQTMLIDGDLAFINGMYKIYKANEHYVS